MTAFVVYCAKGELYDYDFDKKRRDHKLERKRFSYGGMPVEKAGLTIDPSKCIGCGKCVKTCPFGAISLDNHLAYIDAELCKLCRKCVVECPTGAILEVNFPPRKKEPVTAATPPADRIPVSTTVTVPNNSGSDTPAVTPHPNTKPQNPSEPTLF